MIYGFNAHNKGGLAMTQESMQICSGTKIKLENNL